MRLAAIELLDKLHMSYGLRMLEQFVEDDVFTILLRMYDLYPFNDVALRCVTNIIAHALDNKLASEIHQKSKVKSRPSRLLDLEPINQSETETT